MGVQNFNIAPIFPENILPAPNSVFLEKKFPTKRKVSDRLKFGGFNLPSPCQDATDKHGIIRA